LVLLIGPYPCRYLGVNDWKCVRDPSCSANNISLWNPDEFTWLLDDDVDTTVAVSSCAYDRIVISNSLVSRVATTATVLLFDAVYGLNQTETEAVSDHYPVMFTLDART
jgi:hypothetical protein